MNEPKARVLVLCDYFPPASRAGGPTRSIFAIARLESTRNDIVIISRDRDLGQSQPLRAEQVDKVTTDLPAVTIRRLPRHRQLMHLARALRAYLQGADLLYLNSLLSPVYTIWPILLMRFRLVARRPVLLAPRGELSPGALAVKSFKKRLALPILRATLSRLNVTWHASSDREAADIRAFLGRCRGNVIVRANPAPPVEPAADRDSNGGPLTVAFVGRMVPIKNFMLLALAAEKLAVPITIVVAGSIEDNGYWEACRKVLGRAPQGIVVDVRGHLDGVVDLLREMDAMVLPTRGENFGHAIAESLAAGCPVMIPDTTPWSPLVQDGAGWLIDPDDPNVLANALSAYTRSSPDERARIRDRTRSVYRTWWQSHQHDPESLFAQALAGTDFPVLR